MIQRGPRQTPPMLLTEPRRGGEGVEGEIYLSNQDRCFYEIPFLIQDSSSNYAITKVRFQSKTFEKFDGLLVSLHGTSERHISPSAHASYCLDHPII